LATPAETWLMHGAIANKYSIWIWKAINLPIIFSKKKHILNCHILPIIAKNHFNLNSNFNKNKINPKIGP
jgi:hypothetical protein